MVHYQTMKVLNVSSAKTRLGRVIDQVIKTREPVVIPRNGRHVVIMPYQLPSPEEMELAQVFREMDKGRKPVEEDAELLEAIQTEIRKYRAEKRGRK
jgi:prevent-host-death family protein